MPRLPTAMANVAVDRVQIGQLGHAALGFALSRPMALFAAFVANIAVQAHQLLLSDWAVPSPMAVFAALGARVTTLPFCVVRNFDVVAIGVFTKTRLGFDGFCARGVFDAGSPNSGRFVIGCFV